MKRISLLTARIRLMVRGSAHYLEGDGTNPIALFPALESRGLIQVACYFAVLVPPPCPRLGSGVVVGQVLIVRGELGQAVERQSVRFQLKDLEVL